MKLRPGRGTAFAAIIVLLAMALFFPLTSLASGHAQFRSSATPPLAWTPTPRGTVLFEDDFATYSRRWREQKSPKAAIAYRDSALNVRIVSPGVSAWSVPDFTTALEDYRIAVTADVNGGSRDSLFGFVLDYQDDRHFYVLMATREGGWRFVLHEGNEWIDLTPANAVPVERELDSTTVRLRVDVTEDTFTLLVDDRLAGRVTVDDSSASGSGFGLIARAGRGFVDVSFDNILVTGTPKVIRP
jgi:hypothetical protein